MSRSHRPHTAMLAVLVLLVVSACAEVPYSGRYQDAGMPDGTRVDRLVVYKEARLLEAWSGGTLLRTYPVAVGRGGAGPKRFEGDEHTPEGIYLIDSRHPSEQNGYFLHVSYPNPADRTSYRAGVRAGSIPADVGIGGAIGIHGERRGWEWLPHTLFGTAGCIMVEDAAARELYERVERGAVVEIYP